MAEKELKIDCDDKKPVSPILIQGGVGPHLMVAELQAIDEGHQ
jgi:hypothetical protein